MAFEAPARPSAGAVGSGGKPPPGLTDQSSRTRGLGDVDRRRVVGGDHDTGHDRAI
jgi:hypothetical protein